METIFKHISKTQRLLFFITTIGSNDAARSVSSATANTEDGENNVLIVAGGARLLGNWLYTVIDPNCQYCVSDYRSQDQVDIMCLYVCGTIKKQGITTGVFLASNRKKK